MQSTSGLDPTLMDSTQKLLLLQLALKCADLGHLSEELSVHIRYAAGVMLEGVHAKRAERVVLFLTLQQHSHCIAHSCLESKDPSFSAAALSCVFVQMGEFP